MSMKQNATFNYGEGWTPTELLIFEDQLTRIPFSQWPKTEPQAWRMLRNCGPKTVERIQRAGWCKKRATLPVGVEIVANHLGQEMFVTEDQVAGLMHKARAAIEAGELGKAKHPRGYGPHRHKIICDWCGAKYEWPSDVNTWKFDPWTGKRLDA